MCGTQQQPFILSTTQKQSIQRRALNINKVMHQPLSGGSQTTSNATRYLSLVIFQRGSATLGSPYHIQYKVSKRYSPTGPLWEVKSVCALLQYPPPCSYTCTRTGPLEEEAPRRGPIRSEHGWETCSSFRTPRSAARRSGPTNKQSMIIPREKFQLRLSVWMLVDLSIIRGSG